MQVSIVCAKKTSKATELMYAVLHVSIGTPFWIVFLNDAQSWSAVTFFLGFIFYVFFPAVLAFGLGRLVEHSRFWRRMKSSSDSAHREADCD